MKPVDFPILELAVSQYSMGRTLIKRIHHLNFLVKDLEAAVRRYKKLLQTDSVIYEDLPQRGVKTARFKVGETWIVLLQALDADTIPGRHFEQHGEGFFLISYQVDNLDATCSQFDGDGVTVLDQNSRSGLADWSVRDLASDDFFGVNTQLAESGD